MLFLKTTQHPSNLLFVRLAPRPYSGVITLGDIEKIINFIQLETE